VPMQAWFDESGSKGQTRWFVMAGLIGEASAWAEFSDEWSATLAEAPGIRAFKMKDAIGRYNNFRGFSEAERNAKVLRLVRVLDSYAFTSIRCSVDFEPFHRHVDSSLAARDPYQLAFGAMISSVCGDLLERGHRERCSIFFDDRKISGLRIQRFYPIQRIVSPPELQAILPLQPEFRTDEESMPLQAADMLVGLLARFAGHKANPLEWIGDELEQTRVSSWCQIYDEKRLLALQPTDRPEGLADEQIEEARLRFSEIYGPGR